MSGIETEDQTTPRPNAELQELAEARDRLRVQLELARMDLRDELQPAFDDLEHRRQQLEEQWAAVTSAGAESRDGLLAATRLLAGELRAGYARLTDSLSEEV